VIEHYWRSSHQLQEWWGPTSFQHWDELWENVWRFYSYIVSYPRVSEDKIHQEGLCVELALWWPLAVDWWTSEFCCHIVRHLLVVIVLVCLQPMYGMTEIGFFCLGRSGDSLDKMTSTVGRICDHMEVWHYWCLYSAIIKPVKFVKWLF
jgi:hypothetical protein